MPPSDNDDHAEDFGDLIKEFGYGSVNEQATKQLREVIAACKATSSKGSVTLKFSIAAKADLVSVSFALKSSKPEPALPGATYFAGDDGALTTSDPRQLKLPTKVLDVHNVRDIGAKP